LHARDSEPGALLAQFLRVRSTELIQKEETAEEHGQWNPEMEVGSNRAKQFAGTAGLD